MNVYGLMRPVDVFDPQRQTLPDAHTGPINQLSHQLLLPAHAHEQFSNLLNGQHVWQLLWTFRTLQGLQPFEGLLQNLLI